ncbi:calcium-binding protein [Alkalinema sp. FACHB-956]|uniref:calcium-binding protein n=1 Tax=Alkalinema sp. FACHB-956 TaxID=2692768 RepID=UPI0016837728|nr:calcium-binding protein [Alkalinema sp. FACHB-956]MBD2327005.1 calcium-binding protein [Alkalinema sp. FACHB-956]
MGIFAFFSPFNDGSLFVIGDNQNNAITIGRNTAGDLEINNGSVQIFGNRRSFSSNSQIQVFGLGGNDTITIDESKGALPTARIFGGLGDDIIKGGSAIDYLYGEAGNDFIDGNGGNDFAFLGAGDDVFQWDPGDGSDFVEGGLGLDTMIFNGSNGDEIFDFSANGDRLRFFRNLGNIVMDTNDIERVDVNALGGADTITINNLATTDVKDIRLNLGASIGNALGDSKLDSIIINGTNATDTIDLTSNNSGHLITGLAAAVQINGAETTDKLTVNGLGGNDTLRATTLRSDLIQFTADGGDGDDTILGGVGVDILFGGLGNDFIDGNRGNDIAFLGAGDDIFQWDPGDGSDVVEGQAGFDTLRFNGANVAEIFDIVANGDRVLFTRNVASIIMDLNDTEKIELNTLGGADTINIKSLAGTDLQEVFVNLAAAGVSTGDGIGDQINIFGTNGDDGIAVGDNANSVVINGIIPNITVVGMDKIDQFLVHALGGDDIVDGSLFSGNNGTLIQSGGAGNDILLGGLGNDTLLGDDGDDVMLGGAGDDRLDGGNGVDILIGGEGNDVLLNGEVNSQ